MRIVLALALAGALVGCDGVLGPDGGTVSAVLEDGTLRIHNGRKEIVHWIAIGENSLMLWAPCVRPDCPFLMPGTTVRITLADVPAGLESPRLGVHWWVRRDGPAGQPVPGPVHTITVRP